MQDNHSRPLADSAADQSAPANDNLTGLEDENTASSKPVSDLNLRGVISQYEMEILTAWFPKCAETVAGVLRNRRWRLEEEL